jgi:hypothetical protein
MCGGGGSSEDQYDGCPLGLGTYNNSQGAQVGDRNVEIRASGPDCPCYFEDIYGPQICFVYPP